MKKFTKVFKGCLIYLGVAFFISLSYISAAITGNLEITENSLNPIAAVIIVSCVMLIPPIIFMIVLIAKHKVWYYDNPVLDNGNHISKIHPAQGQQNVAKEVELSYFKEESEQENNNIGTNASDSLITTEKLSLLRQQLAKERQDRERNHSLLYFRENSPALIEKYAKFVVNFIEKLLEKADYLFVRMFKDSTIPLMSTLVFPYRNSNSQILLNAIKNDGLHFTESNNPEFNKGVQQLTDYFVKGLKKRIEEANEWQDELTLPLLLYVIVRNNVIKFYHDKYLTEFGYESLEELCKNVPNRVFDNNSGIEIFSEINNLSQVVSTIGTVYHVYYYIYEKDINLPFVDTYQKICTDINNLRTLQTEKKLEDDLFGSSKKRNMATPQSVATELSPIEQIDNMSGEEFELFMTQYFKSQGFKTTHTPISGDYGIDLIIENDFGKIGVQAKCYSNKVSLDAVQQVVAGLRYYGLSSGLVITNNYFQPSAIKLAASNNITLWDRNKLIEKLGE